MASLIPRPSAEEYHRALQLYRTGATAEQIAEQLEWTDDQVECLIEVGWPAEGEKVPELRRLRAEIRERITRVRASELDVLQEHAEAAAKTAPLRARSGAAAAQIEQAILTAWGRAVVETMRVNPTLTDPSLLCQPKSVLDNLRALRAIQAPDVERAHVEIFQRAASRGGEGADSSSLEDQIFGDLAEMSSEEQAQYALTGRRPAKQQVLPFPAETKEGAA